MHAGKQHDLELKLLKAADDVNERQKTILTERLLAHWGGSFKGKTVAIWGLAFKPRTDDVRRAPSLKIMEELFLNGAKVRAFDRLRLKMLSKPRACLLNLARPPLMRSTEQTLS